MENKHLFRSATTKVFGGVAGGIAEYFGVDPIIIRLLFVIIAFAGGGGFLVYIILWVALPLEPIKPFSMNMGQGTPFSTGQNTTDSEGTQETSFDANPSQPPYQMQSDQKTRNGLIGGIALIALGLVFLANRIIPSIDFHQLWPLVLVVVGGVLIATSLAENKKNKMQE